MTGTYSCTVLRRNCTGCGICVDVCHFDAIDMPQELAYPEPAAGACTGCMVCEKQCPFGAIEVQKL